MHMHVHVHVHVHSTHALQHTMHATYVRTFRSCAKRHVSAGTSAGSVGSSRKGTCKGVRGACEGVKGVPHAVRSSLRGCPSRVTRLHQVEGRHRTRGSGATSAHVRQARVAVGEVREQHAPRVHLVAHLVRVRARG